MQAYCSYSRILHTYILPEGDLSSNIWYFQLKELR